MDDPVRHLLGSAALKKTIIAMQLYHLALAEMNNNATLSSFSNKHPEDTMAPNVISNSPSLFLQFKSISSVIVERVYPSKTRLSFAGYGVEIIARYSFHYNTPLYIYW